MAGEFLPPVVTTLDGEIQPLLDKLAEAKAAIKALGNTKFDVPIKISLDQASLARVKTELKNALGDIKVGVKPDMDAAAFASSLATMRATAAASPITVPVRFDVDRGFTPFVAPGGVMGIGGAGFNWQATQYPNAGLMGQDQNRFSAGNLFSQWFAARSGNMGRGTTPGWWGWAGGVPMGAVHAGIYGGLGLLAGAAGGLVDLGALSAVWANGVSRMVGQGQRMTTATEMLIPPGTPDYALARAFGLNVGPNSPLAKASLIGNGQALGAYGGLVNLANTLMGKGGFLSGIGLSSGSNLDNFIGRVDARAASGTGALQAFANMTRIDAANVGKGLTNILSMIGHIGMNMPGEIEWLTTGFKDVTGLGNDLFTNKYTKGIMGSLVFGGLLTHGVGVALKYGSKGLGALGLGAEGGMMEGLGAMSFADMFTNPLVLGGAGFAAAALMAYRHQNATSAQMLAFQNGLSGVSPMTYANNLPNYIGLSYQNLLTPGAKQGSFLGYMFGANGVVPPSGWGESGGFMNRLGDRLGAMIGINSLPNTGFLGRMKGDFMNAVTFGLYNKEATPYFQYEHALSGFSSDFINSGSTWNKMAKAMGISPAMAAYMATQAGVQMGKNGTPVGGMFQALMLMRNYRRAMGIMNGGSGETMANMGVLQMTNDSAWKSAGQINSAWDAYIGAMTAGPTNYGNLLQVLQRVAPSLAKNLSSPTGMIPTSAGIMSAGQPLLDFFRQAQAAGAVTGSAIPHDFALVAASMAPLAGSSKTAQQELLALANEGGSHFTTMAQLMKAAGGSEKNTLKQIQAAIGGTTAAMAKLPPFAQTMAQAVSSNVNAMAESIVSKDANAKGAFDHLIQTMEKFPGNAQKINAAAGPLAAALHQDGMKAWQVQQIMHELGVQGYYASGGLKAAASAWNNIQSGVKTLTLDVFTGISNAAGQVRKHIPHHALGVQNSVQGSWSWVGERGPELAYLPSGSTVIPSFRTGQVTAQAMTSGATEHHTHVYIDGAEVFSGVKSRTFEYNVVNGNRDRGGRVRGTMRPRG